MMYFHVSNTNTTYQLFRRINRPWLLHRTERFLVCLNNNIYCTREVTDACLIGEASVNEIPNFSNKKIKDGKKKKKRIYDSYGL